MNYTTTLLIEAGRLVNYANKSNPFFDPGAKRPLQIFSPDVPNVKNRKDGNPAEKE